MAPQLKQDVGLAESLISPKMMGVHNEQIAGNGIGAHTVAERPGR